MKIGRITVQAEQVQCENIEITTSEIPELNKLIDNIRDTQLSIIAESRKPYAATRESARQ